jgi:hypothetical protein
VTQLDLYAELGNALKPAYEEDKIRSRIFDLGIRCPLVGYQRIIPEKAHYQPEAESGEPFLIYPVLSGPHMCDPESGKAHARLKPVPLDLDGRPVSVVDLVAFRPDRPDAVYLRLGNAWALGEWECRWWGDQAGAPLRLHSTPTAWIASYCAGAYVLDWSLAVNEIMPWPEVVCDTLALAEKVEAEVKAARRRLTPKVPKVLVKEA